MEITTRSWHATLECGNELNGAEYGSFASVKHRPDIIDVYVITGAGKVHAARRPGMKPMAFDFYVHVAVDIEPGSPAAKHYKLITRYPGHALIRHVWPDGRNYTERIPQ